MGLFRRKRSNEDCRLVVHADASWSTVSMQASGASFLRLFLPAATLDAALTTISPGRRAELIDEASIVAGIDGSDEQQRLASTSGLLCRSIGDESAPYFRDRMWVAPSLEEDGSIVVEAALTASRKRAGAITQFRPFTAATDDAMIELFRTCWDWLPNSDGIDEHDAMLGSMLVGGVAIFHREAIRRGERMSAIDRGKALSFVMNRLPTSSQ